MTAHQPKRGRSGGRAGNARRGATETIAQMPWQQPVNIDRPTEPLPPRRRCRDP